MTPGTGGSPCAEVRVGLGAYVVGALEPAERAAVEQHTGSCQSCRDCLAELAGLPGLLGRLTVAEVARGTEVAAGGGLSGAAAGGASPRRRLLADLLAAAASHRRAQRRRRRLVAAAVLAALALGGGLGVRSVLARHLAYTAARTAAGVHAGASLHDRAWGTSVTLRLSGVAPGVRCRLVAISRSGTTEDAGWWRTDYEGSAAISAATSVARGDLAALRVVAADNRTLATISVLADR